MNFTVGQTLSSWTRAAFTAEQLQEYAEASGDKNPIHLSTSFAQEAGFPSVIVHGMLSMAYVADYIRKNFPDDQYVVQKFRARFKKVTFPGDVLTLKGEVKNRDGATLTLLVWAENQKGETTVDGDAIIVNRAK